MKSNKFVLFILIPMMIHMMIFMILPIIGGGLVSFMEYNPLRADNAFIGFENYAKMLGDKVFIKALTNTLVFVSVTVVLNIVIALALSALISQLESNKSRSFFRAMVFLPCIAPMVATSVVFGRSIFPAKSGLLNIIIRACGGDAINWIGDANYLMISVIIFTIWADVGYNTILLSAGMDGIPKDLYSAASIDGAGRWRKFVSITFPLLGRTFSFVTVMTLISHFQMFAQFNVIAYQGGPQNSGIVLTSYIYKVAFQNKDMGYASAIAISLFVLILGITLLQQKLNKIDWEY